jgi:hypothetical protein
VVPSSSRIKEGPSLGLQEKLKNQKFVVKICPGSSIVVVFDSKQIIYSLFSRDHDFYHRNVVMFLKNTSVKYRVEHV